MIHVNLQLPDKAAPLLVPAPYKVIYGGRGKAASWSMARALLTLGVHRKLFIVCAREVQKSIKDSVHKLLADQVELLGLQKYYDVLDVEIRGKNGTTFVFHGLNNVNSLRSLEAADVLWVTEANHVAKSKWIVLEPTFRRDPPFGPFKQGSEIWIDLNPELATDDTYARYVVDPPEGAVVIYMSYRDNPWFPQKLRSQMEEMRRKDYEEYLTTWEGRTRKTLSGSIFAKELGAAIEEGRVTPHVKWHRDKGVTLVFDLGDADMTAAWALQQIGHDHLVIDYMEESQQAIDYFIKAMQEAGYIIRRVILPHDARQSHQAARGLVNNTIEKQVRALLPTPGIVRVQPITSDATQISALRMLFPRLYINEVKASRGVLCLQHYRFGVDPVNKTRTKVPIHDWASHGSKALCYYAVDQRDGTRMEREAATGKTETVSERRGSNAWMGA